MRNLFCILLFSLLSTFGLFSQEPLWLDNNYRLQTYPFEVFLQAFSFSSKNNNEKIDDLLKRLSADARNQLLESIKVTIKSNSSLKTENTGSKTIQILKQEITTLSDADLSGLKYETFFDKEKNTGYAFAYVNKSDLISYHKTNILHKFEKASQKYEIVTSNNILDVKQALILLLESLRELSQIERSQDLLIALNALNEKTSNTRQTLSLERQVNQKFSDILDSIKLQPGITGLIPTFNNSWQFPVSIKTTIGTPSGILELKNVPVIFYSTFTNEKLGSAISDDLGNAAILLKSAPISDKNKRITVKLNLPTFLDIDSNSYIFNSIIKTINIPSVTFEISFTKIPIILLRGEYCSGIIESGIKEALIKEGFVFTSNKETACYSIELSCNLRKGIYISGIQFAYVDASIQIIENSTGLSLYQYKVTDCKGGGTDYNQALNKAFKSASNKLTEELINYFNQ